MIDKLGDRMKMYEQMEAGRKLMPGLPICIRVDGRAFHTFTKGMQRPYDENMSIAMIETMKFLVEQTDACIGYVQSDEISLILSDIKAPMFDGKVAKLNSVIASMATAKFNDVIHKTYPNKPYAFFDCRCWNTPSRYEAVNNILWREFDATKNSISMAARSKYSDAALLGKNSSQKQDMLMEAGINWNDYPVFFKRGTYARRVVTTRKFTEEELELLPQNHEARKNPDLVITRSSIELIDMPILTTVTNKVEVIFDGADPIVEIE